MTDFGGKLRQARERRGVSLRQIAASTKISVGALEALERNDVSKLPGGIFSRAFVRSYASEVGLDPDETVREFLERFDGESSTASGLHSAAPGHASHQAAHGARETPPRHARFGEDESAFESQRRMAAVMIKLLLVSLPLAGIILYLTLGRGRADTPPGVVQPESPGSAAVTPGAGEPPAEPALHIPPSPAAEQPLVLEIHPTAACWVSLTVDGQRVTSRLMQPGEKEVRRIRDSAVIDVGDAGAFAFSINGRPGRPLGQSGQVKTARITRANISEYVR